ncbi:MAG: endonuclease/exonuclease/phosphatase family protein, partial [Bacteroidia bacterium]
AIHSKEIPTVVLGDFNDPPGSYVYQTIKKNYTNAFSTNAWGPGATYSGPIPFLRIDNILISNDLHALKYRCLSSKISDHHPIQASIQWD